MFKLVTRGVQLFQSFPRKGMETFIISIRLITSHLAFSIISPQGDGNDKTERSLELLKALFFFNHFPARGWKQRAPKPTLPIRLILFQSFPRKGMETSLTSTEPDKFRYASFSIISPQGDGNPLFTSGTHF